MVWYDALRVKIQDQISFSRFVWQTVIAPWPPFLWILIAVGIIGAIQPLVHITATRHLIDMLIAHTETGLQPGVSLVDQLMPYIPWLLLLIAMTVVHWIVYMASFQQYLAAEHFERVRERFDDRFYRKALSLRLAWFEQAEHHDAMHRAHHAVNDMVSRNVYQVQRIVSCTFGAISILWMLSLIHPGLALLLLVGGVYMMRWSMAQQTIILQLQFDQTPLQRRQAYWARLMTERPAASEIRLFGLGDYMVGTWRAVTDRMISEIVRMRTRYSKILLVLLGILAGLFGTTLMGLLYIASTGAISTGELVAMFYAVNHYLWFLHNTGHRVAQAQRLMHELRYAETFFATGEAYTEPMEGPSPHFTEEIRFDQVSFTYPANKNSVISDISLVIQPGEKIALVGENGAGKTTFIKLLLGLYQPTEGVITVDDVDLQQVSLDQWRAQTGVVFQDYMRYAFSMRENVGVGKLDCMQDTDAIQHALTMSSAIDLMDEMPNGLETILGREFKDGHELSGGQWQKLAIARAYLRDAPLLVLDEPASALDALAELEIYRQFLALSQNKTVLLISHRLGSARLADRILFLENGKLIEQGSHDELMNLNGAYARLYAMQAEWYRDTGRTQDA